MSFPSRSHFPSSSWNQCPKASVAEAHDKNLHDVSMDVVDDASSTGWNNAHLRDIAVQSSASSVKEEEDSGWGTAFPVELLQIIASSSKLSLCDLARCTRVCKHWRIPFEDNITWRNRFKMDYRINKNDHLKRIQASAKFTSWKEEYCNLRQNVPSVQVQLIRDHRDEVLHVAFSHDGSMFSSCSKDGFVKVWDSSAFPFRRLFQCNMSKELQPPWKYTQFSSFNSSDTLLLVSGVYHGPMSTSGEVVIFSIEDGFKIRCRVRNKPYDIFGSWLDDTHLITGNLHWTTHLESCCSLSISRASQDLQSERVAVMQRAYKFRNVNGSSIRTLLVARPFGPDREEVYLVFSTGDVTYIPHQIGVKKLTKSTIPFPGLTDQRTLQNALLEFQLQQEANHPDAVQFDAIDHIFNLNAQIIGLSLSPDSRYLYANCRSWPENVVVGDPFQPPPISSEVEIRCFDLQTLQQVPMTYRAHRAYTPSEECFFIFVDVSNSYVASGAEDSKGYIWHRHHNIKLASLQHQSVVNCVAFNPVDEETLVTVSDDYTIRVWFSRRKCDELGLNYVGQKVCGVDQTTQCDLGTTSNLDFDMGMNVNDDMFPEDMFQ